MDRNTRSRRASVLSFGDSRHLAPYEPDPMARKFVVELPKPTLEDPAGDGERLLSALSGASPEMAPGKVRVSFRLLQRLSPLLREASFRVTATLAQMEDAWEVIDIQESRPSEGFAPSSCFGLGVDVGTTTVSIYLVDMTAGEIVGRSARANPQVAHGEDILSRIHFCQTAGGLQTLRELVAGCINDGLASLVCGHGLRAEEICAVSVAGNPAMMHLLLGADPYHLCREPYAPVFNRSLTLRAEDLLLNANPDAPVYVFPGLGSYFGGDVVAGVLASGMHGKDATSLLVDVGTNAEIVLGNREWLVVCAGAAGPALEGGGVKAGMPAGRGAIEAVRIDGETLEPETDVIGGGAAQGICGSGVIDLIAELYLAGIIDPKGRIRDRARTPRKRKVGDARGYAVALADRGEATGDVVVDELDIGNFLRAKGAMYTALTLVTERMGVGFDEIESFFVAGSFGEHINPRSAVTVGMLPDIALDRFKVLGNSAGLGACMMLLSYRLREEVEFIRSRTTYLQLTTDNEFMNRLNAAIFIPHTDRELFPTVPRQA